MDVILASVPTPTPAPALGALECFSFCPNCLTREFFMLGNRERVWTHCSKRHTAIPYIDCPTCNRRFEFSGSPQCPLCFATFANGVPLPPSIERKGILDGLLKRRGAARDRAKQRTDLEFRALYASWRQESTGIARVSEFGETRFGQELEAVQATHNHLLTVFADDIDKFLYGAPIRLAKFEAEYSWKIDQELRREIDQVLEGMLRDKFSVQFSLPFLARYRQRFPHAYSRNYLAVELAKLFQERRQAPRPSFQLTLDYARSLSGLDFEEWLARLLREAGIPGVSITQASRDQGADLVITIGSRKIVMQAKQNQDTTGNSAVQQVHGALPYYGATEAWVVTTSSFSKDAIDLAYRTGVKLVSGNQLLNLPNMLRETGSDAVQARSEDPAPSTIEQHSSNDCIHIENSIISQPAGEEAVDVTGKSQASLLEATDFSRFQKWERWKVICAAAGGTLVFFAVMAGLVTSLQGHPKSLTETVPTETRSQIVQVLENYRAAELRRDPRLLAQFYAPTVEAFYLKRSVSRADVQAEFERAFAAYSEVHQINFSNIVFRNTSPSQTTTEFEKSWDLRGARNYSGAEREKMIFRKIGGTWFIVSERELKIHWTRRTKAASSPRGGQGMTTE